MFDKILWPLIVLCLVALVTFVSYGDAQEAKNGVRSSVTGRSAPRQFTADIAVKLGPTGVLASGGAAGAVCLVWMSVAYRKAKLTG